MKENPFFQKVIHLGRQRETYIQLLRDIPLFYSLNDEDSQALLDVCHYVTYAPNELIFTEGEPGTTLHVVVEGQTVVSRGSGREEGRLAELGAGSILGEIAFFCATPRSASAHSGPKGTVHLVITSESYMDLSLKRPLLFQTVLHSLIESVGKRLQRLPPMYRNYILFGYLPERAAHADAEGKRIRTLHPVVYGLLGATYGFFLGLIVVLALGQYYPVLAEARGAIALACEITGILCGVGGFVTGFLINYLDARKQRQEANDRNCGNCKFVAWDSKGERFDCLLLLGGAASPGVRKSERHDTYTDCTSFEMRPFGEATTRQRDSMSNLD